MKSYTYLAINENNEGFICEAINKEQMKHAGVNMKLTWNRYNTYDNAVNELKCRGIELKSSSDVTNFGY
jgi:hypothetical protein